MKIRASIWACLVVLSANWSFVSAGTLLRIGQPPTDASLVSVSADGAMQFKIDGKVTNLTLQELLRWSAPRENLDQVELLLTDGSRLVLAEAWAEQDPWWSTNDERLHVVSDLVGHFNLSRDDVRAVLVNGSKDVQRRRRQVDQILSYSKQADLLRLVNEDSWSGKFINVSSRVGGVLRPIRWRLASTNQVVEIPERRVASIVFGSAKKMTLQGILVVGLSDGSLLFAKSLVANKGRFQVRLVNDFTLEGQDLGAIVYLRSLEARCHYLSDGVPIEYQHRPYLDIEWPYRRDRNVVGGPLRAGGQQYEKGLGVATATRLTYEVDSELPNKKFIAAVAVDDVAQRRGSAIFRVYVRGESEWQSVYTSPVMRGGDPPVPLVVEVGGARQLALVTDFADRGDERDYANWLEARVE